MKVTIIFFAIALCRMRHVTFDDGFGDGDVDVVATNSNFWFRASHILRGHLRKTLFFIASRTSQMARICASRSIDLFFG